MSDVSQPHQDSEGEPSTRSLLTVAERIPFPVLVGGLFVIVFYLLHHGNRIDFNVSYAGGLSLRHGHNYIDQSQIESIHHHLGLIYSKQLASVPYGPPPAMALLFYPLSFLGYRAAFGVFTALTVAAWTWLLCCAPQRLRILVLLAAVSMPAVDGFYTGNISILMSPIFLLCVLAAYRKKYVYSAILLALASILKLFPVALFAVFLAKRKYRETTWGIGVFAGGYLLTLLVMGAHRFGDVVSFTRTLGTKVPIFSANQTLAGFSKFEFSNPSITTAMSFIGIGIFIMFLWILRKQELGVSLNILSLALLVALSQSWSHYYVMTFPALLFAFQHRDRVELTLRPLVLFAILLVFDIRGVVLLTTAPHRNHLFDVLTRGILGWPQLIGSVLLLLLIPFLLTPVEMRNSTDSSPQNT